VRGVTGDRHGEVRAGLHRAGDANLRAVEDDAVVDEVRRKRGGRRS
jgi:hypothetical protein